jgi:hypothetical protein
MVIWLSVHIMVLLQKQINIQKNKKMKKNNKKDKSSKKIAKKTNKVIKESKTKNKKITKTNIAKKTKLKILAKKPVKKITRTQKTVKGASKKQAGQIIKSDRMSTTSLAYLLSGIYEAVLALPILGWLMGIHSFGFFWIVGIVINATAIVITIKAKKATYGNIIGVVANVFGIIPIFGWFLHLIATTLIFSLFFKEERG